MSQDILTLTVMNASLRYFVMEKGSGGECFQLIQQINLQ